MVDFSFISARFLGADDADKTFAPPSEDHPVHLRVGPAQSDEANLSVIFPVVDSLQNLVGKDFRGGQERNLMFIQVDFGFLLVPLELQFQASPRRFNIIHKCVHERRRRVPICGSFSSVGASHFGLDVVFRP